MFSLRSNFFDFTSLRQGQFLANDGEKSEKIKSKKILSKDTQRVLFHYRDKFPLCDLVQGKPRNPNSKSKNGTRFARVFSKAKAHDSKNRLAANIFKSGFSEGGNRRIFFVSLVDTR